MDSESEEDVMFEFGREKLDKKEDNKPVNPQKKKKKRSQLESTTRMLSGVNDSSDSESDYEPETMGHPESRKRMREREDTDSYSNQKSRNGKPDVKRRRISTQKYNSNYIPEPTTKEEEEEAMRQAIERSMMTAPASEQHEMATRGDNNRWGNNDQPPLNNRPAASRKKPARATSVPQPTKRRLTAKQQQKQIERERKREEREKNKREKEKKKEEEKKKKIKARIGAGTLATTELTCIIEESLFEEDNNQESLVEEDNQKDKCIGKRLVEYLNKNLQMPNICLPAQEAVPGSVQWRRHQRNAFEELNSLEDATPQALVVIVWPGEDFISLFAEEGTEGIAARLVDYRSRLERPDLRMILILQNVEVCMFQAMEIQNKVASTGSGAMKGLVSNNYVVSPGTMQELYAWLFVNSEIEVKTSRTKEETAITLASYSEILAKVPYEEEKRNEFSNVKREKPPHKLRNEGPGAKFADAYLAMLMMIPGVSGEKAHLIAQKYPSFDCLIEAVETLPENQRDEALAHCFGTRKHLALSKKIMRFFAASVEDKDKKLSEL
eukprot:TRINITY_DN68690_c0_g2_i1.p1 TRINITY_DN68690_c0_g2~~TRINITY_DN68690_c0_g2_i1.p1  ORF type:complete len:552 (+),score=138.13 TRINITY_DN68690_c0_g2_i1:282-1937(+)